MAGDEEVEEVADLLYIDDCSKDSENSKFNIESEKRWT